MCGESSEEFRSLSAILIHRTSACAVFDDRAHVRPGIVAEGGKLPGSLFFSRIANPAAKVSLREQALRKCVNEDQRTIVDPDDRMPIMQKRMCVEGGVVNYADQDVGYGDAGRHLLSEFVADEASQRFDLCNQRVRPLGGVHAVSSSQAHRVYRFVKTIGDLESHVLTNAQELS